METLPIDFEIVPRVKKARRFFVFLLENLVISIVTLFAFAFISVNIMKSIPDYQNQENDRIHYRNELNKVGIESKLACFYRDGSPVDEYGMYVRYCYKHINLMFKLYPQDFIENGFKSVADPYEVGTADKENDELFYFFTNYGISNGVISADKPVSNYVNNIIDLSKHNSIMVYNENLGMLTLNPKVQSGNGTYVNFGVSLYTELYDNNKSFAMNSMNKFYVEYYDLANELLTKTTKYQSAYSGYEIASLNVGKYISFTYVFNYLAIALPYFLIMPLATKAAKTPGRSIFKIGLFGVDGFYLPIWKRILYALIQVFLYSFMLFFTFYIGYGLNFFSYPFGIIGNFLITPLLFIVVSFVLFFVNSILLFLPIFNEEKATPIEYLLKIRYMDLRDEER